MANTLIYKNEELSIGDTVAVYQNIVEGEKTRVQMFEGVIIAIQNREENKSFVVRKIATGGIGVEKIFPVQLPSIDKIVVKRRGIVRRSKLYHLRKRIGKDAVKLKEKKIINETKTSKPKAKTDSKAAAR
ncbi:MAG: 50S ribosomal protein L19 [Patescibacteria group bacterium]